MKKILLFLLITTAIFAQRGEYNYLRLRDLGSVIVSDYDSLNAAITAISTTEKELVINEDVTIGGGTIPSTMRLRFVQGAKITISDTLTINGEIDAGSWQIFDGIVDLSQSNVGVFYPEWWGANSKDEVSDNTAMMNMVSSLNLLTAFDDNNSAYGHGNIELQRGKYIFSDPMDFGGTRLSIIGKGVNQSILNFTGTDSTAIKAYLGGNRRLVTLKDFTLVADSSAGNGIDIQRLNRGWLIENVNVQNFDSSCIVLNDALGGVVRNVQGHDVGTVIEMYGDNGGDATIFEMVMAYGFDDYGIYIHDIADRMPVANTILNCFFYDGANSDTLDDGVGIYILGSSRHQIINGWFERVKIGIETRKTATNSINQMLIQGGEFTSIDSMGVVLGAGQGYTLIGVRADIEAKTLSKGIMLGCSTPSINNGEFLTMAYSSTLGRVLIDGDVFLTNNVISNESHRIIGDTTPYLSLEDTSGNVYRVRTSSGDFQIRDEVNATNLFYGDKDGTTITPTSNYFGASASGHRIITLYSGTTSVGAIRFNDGSDDGAITYSHSDREVKFNAAGSERMKIGTNISINSLPTYADNAAATSGGLSVGDLYQTSTGQLMIVY